MSTYTPPPVEPVRAHLTLGGRGIDLATRALVLAVVPSPTWARESEVTAAVRAAADAGADLAEVPADPRLLGPAAQQGGLPVAARVTTPAAARAVAHAGAAAVLVPQEHLGRMTLGMDADVPVVVLAPDARSVPAARELGKATADSETVVAIDTLHLAAADLVAEASLALAAGARMVRTGDVRRARRVVEVMANLLEARR